MKKSRNEIEWRTRFVHSMWREVGLLMGFHERNTCDDGSSFGCSRCSASMVSFARLNPVQRNRFETVGMRLDLGPLWDAHRVQKRAQYKRKASRSYRSPYKSVGLNTWTATGRPQKVR